jgi:ADP-ribosylglycohydrolase
LPRQISSQIYANFKCPDLSHTELLDRIYGSFFGFIIGDSIGSYLAFYTSKIDELTMQSLLMTGGGSYNLNPGQGTDDTEIAFSLADGLIQG